MPGGLLTPGRASGFCTHTSHSSPSGSRKKTLKDRPEIGHEPVGRAAGHEPVTDRLERLERSGVERQVVDSAPPEHRGLPLRFAVPVDLEHVQLGVRADVDDGKPHVGALGCLGPVAGHGRVKHLLVERVQTLRVLGEDRHVVEPVEQHARQRTRPIGGR